MLSAFFLIASISPYSFNHFAAVLTPTFGTPGILSELSPTRASKSLILRKRKIEVYYPKLGENHKMTFNKSPLNPEFVNNRYGIPELINNDFVNPSDLSLAVIPLVGVDASGYRLGYGGGYFDRIFNSDKKQHAPITIGLGYEYQILSDEFKESHDMRYSLVITEENIYNFNLRL